MTTKFWLALDPSPYTNRIDFSNPDVLVVPVVPLQTGGSRSQVSPGIYRQPRIRIYSDKFGTVTGLSDQKEISFPALLYGDTYDEIYAAWKQISFYLNRAELAAAPFPRGSGVVLVEQFSDANLPTVWDVVSGVLSDVDPNMPDVGMAIAIVQLSVLPFSRGDVQTVGFGATRVSGTGSSYYVPYPGGDAPGLFELRLKDMSASGHEITWVSIGRRWAPKMLQSDFTSWYPLNSPIRAVGQWQLLLPIVGTTDWEAFDWDTIDWDGDLFGSPLSNDVGAQQTGLFGAYAVVNDESPVISGPTDISLTPISGSGSLANGFLEVVFDPIDTNGVPAPPTAHYLATLDNPNEPGNVQDSESFESGKWDSWRTPPVIEEASGGSASLTINATAAIEGQLGAHFKVTGNAVGGSITSASASRLMPPMAGNGIQSIAFDIEPISWGSWLSPTPITAPASGPVVNTSVAYIIPPPSVPSVSYITGGSGYLGDISIAYTWTSGYGETTLGGISTRVGGITPVSQINVIIPALPFGANGANIYTKFSGASVFTRWNATIVGPGTYSVTPSSYPTQPPTVNTTQTPSNFSGGVTYHAAITWLSIYGETTSSPLTSFTNASPFNATLTVPAFPAGVVAAGIYVSRTMSGTTVTVEGSVSSPGDTAIGQGSLGGWSPPSVNTTGTPTPGSWDATPRFTWGSLQICPSGTHNNFILKIGGNQVGAAFALLPNEIHRIGCSFRQIGTQAVYNLIVDDAIIGTLSDAIGTLTLPITAEWAAIGAGTGGPYTEEYYLDEIYVYDALLQPGFRTVGSNVTILFTPDANTASMDLYFALHETGAAAAIQWYRIASVASPYVLSTPIPNGAVPVTGPPTAISLGTSFAQLQARIGAGNGSTNLLAKPIVRTKVANGVDELVRLGSLELPPGAKSDTRALDGWTLQLWGKSGANTGHDLTVKGVALFPEDEDGWTGITAKAPSIATTGTIWHIGTNKYGRPYAQLFAADGSTLLGYADITGALGSMAGDQNFVVMVGRVDANNNVLIDLTQTFQLGHQVTSRQHWEATAVGRP